MSDIKNNSYDKWWLRKDMENMGYIFEYCAKYCKQSFGTKINTEMFLTDFMKANIRYEMETGNVQLLSESGRDTVEKFVKIDLDGNLEKYKVDKLKAYRVNEMYWIGWMYAYIHYEMDMLSAEIIKRLPISRMRKDYKLGHEMSKEVYLKHIKEEITTNGG